MTEQSWQRAFLCFAFLGPFSFLRYNWGASSVPLFAVSILLSSYLLCAVSLFVYRSREQTERS